MISFFLFIFESDITLCSKTFTCLIPFNPVYNTNLVSFSESSLLVHSFSKKIVHKTGSSMSSSMDDVVNCVEQEFLENFQFLDSNFNYK